MTVSYELWKLPSASLFAVRLEDCDEFVVSDDDELVVYLDCVKGYVGPLLELPETLRVPEDLQRLPYVYVPDYDNYDTHALELDLCRPDAEILMAFDLHEKQDQIKRAALNKRRIPQLDSGNEDLEPQD